MDKLSLFGKTYNTIGSTDSNLILKTKGDLKVQWGGKFIDIIKNGKIASTSTNILKTITNSEEIDKDGIYITSEDNLAWVSIDGNKINVSGDTGTTYVSFLTKLKDITSDLKYMALTNAGLYYETLEDVLAAEIKAGLIFIAKENKLYTVSSGVLSEYILSNSQNETLNKYFDSISVDLLRIYKSGTYMNIESPKLLFWIGGMLFIDLTNSILSHVSLEMRSGTYIQSIGANSTLGFRLYENFGKSVLDIDDINLRGDLNRLSYIEVTYDLLRILIDNNLLIISKEYKLTDFQNAWEANTDKHNTDIYDDDKVLIIKQNVRPIILKARSKNTLELKSYFFDNPEWILHYDYTFNEAIQIIDGDSTTEGKEKGRIIYLEDEYSNSANYDFKHLLFKIEDSWYYTFSNELGMDLSLDGDYTGNSVTIKNIAIENKNTLISGKSKLVFLNPTYDNVFKNFEGITTISGEFNSNVIFSKWEENLILSTILNCEFQENVTKTTFSKSLTDCMFKSSITNTDIFTKVELRNCLINNNILEIIELPETTLIETLKSLEPKLVVVIVKESKLYLSMSSGSLLTIPSGIILMWAGNKEIPFGWVICDGKNGTPNLLGRFIKAVGTVEELGEITSVLNTDNELIINLENLPKHTHPHQLHTHDISFGTVEATAENSGVLTTTLNNLEYITGDEVVYKTIITSVTGEGITSKAEAISEITNIKTKGGIATGGDHTHNIKIAPVEQGSLKSSESKEVENIEWLNTAIKIEPRSYALMFIMKL